jgi:hypothetical protein
MIFFSSLQVKTHLIITCQNFSSYFLTVSRIKANAETGMISFISEFANFFLSKQKSQVPQLSHNFSKSSLSPK